ncbi:MAG: aspartate/glutamate racemase family protein [Rhodococcus sp. (in: high G+C Gram-positive bacteria)]
MNVALIDSGLGSLPTAAHLRRLRPMLDLHLYLDPDDAPWGPKPVEWTERRVVDTALRAVDEGADVVVLPCNTASVVALDVTRSALGSIPVVGTVPAIKPAAREHHSIAIWATAATTASPYQARLVREFAHGASVTAVACHGLADAIDRGDGVAITSAIASAAARTPDDVQAIVLGCTHYPLVADEIMASLPVGVTMFDSATAVAAQTLRRLDELDRRAVGSGSLAVTLSGRPGSLPDSALSFAAGLELAAPVTF